MENGIKMGQKPRFFTFSPISGRFWSFSTLSCRIIGDKSTSDPNFGHFDPDLGHFGLFSPFSLFLHHVCRKGDVSFRCVFSLFLSFASHLLKRGCFFSVRFRIVARFRSFRPFLPSFGSFFPNFGLFGLFSLILLFFSLFRIVAKCLYCHSAVYTFRRPSLARSVRVISPGGETSPFNPP